MYDTHRIYPFFPPKHHYPIFKTYNLCLCDAGTEILNEILTNSSHRVFTNFLLFLTWGETTSSATGPIVNGPNNECVLAAGGMVAERKKMEVL